jgi:acetyltransferase-like isoleucine patch superfamily enzyme
MARYEDRSLQPTPAAEKAFLEWVDSLDKQFLNHDADHRSSVVRDALHQLYLGKRYTPPYATAPLGEQTLLHSFDSRNVTLEPEYYGDVDAEKYAKRKPLLWFWMMFDRSPVGPNLCLSFPMRAMLARHIFRHCGKNVKIYPGVEVSFGYNLTVEDDCVVHSHVRLDDRGEIVVRAGTVISDYAQVFSHTQDLQDSAMVEHQKTEIGPHARVACHAVVLGGTKIGERALVPALEAAGRK